MERYRDADLILKRMIDDYPDSEDRAGLMTLRANQLEMYLKDNATAKRVFKAIVAEYPGTDLATSAEGSLKMMDADANFEDGELPDFFETPGK